MKTTISHKPAERGNALLVALFLCLILSVTIAGYLKHAQQQNYISTRSQTWNLSMTVTEAAVEEALQHLNSNSGNLAVDDWSRSGTIYTVSRQLNGTSDIRYTVKLDMANPFSPIISAQSFIKSVNLAANSDLAPTFAVGGVNVVAVQPTTISRAVKVTAGKNSLFLKAMVAKHLIDMNGNNVMTDSFNSASPSNSVNGLYPAGQPSKLLSNGDVASNDNVANTVNVGNANIFGHVAVGPGGTIYLGPNGGVGDRSWVTANPGQIQDGYFSQDMNFTFKSVELPEGFVSYQTPLSGTVTTTTYVETNATVTSASYPSPAPATGVQTNVSTTTSSAKPSPQPYGLVTNILTTSTSSSTYPATGTYVGTPTKSGSKWKYNKIYGTNYTYSTYTYTYAVSGVTPIETTTGYDYVLLGTEAGESPAKYFLSEVNGQSILVKGNAILVVAGNFSLGSKNSGKSLTLDSKGQLEMYIGGTSVDVSGNGAVNPSGLAQNLMIYCTDSVTSFALNGNGQFTGCIYAPCADFQLNGGGNAPQDFVGALVANSVKMNGHYSFHYDEALGNYRGTGRYIVKQWTEIPVTTLSDIQLNK